MSGQRAPRRAEGAVFAHVFAGFVRPAFAAAEAERNESRLSPSNRTNTARTGPKRASAALSQRCAQSPPAARRGQGATAVTSEGRASRYAGQRGRRGSRRRSNYPS